MNFTLACRWISPKSQGGVAIHNGYLLQLLKNDCQIQVFSVPSEANKAYYKSFDSITYQEVPSKTPQLLFKLARTHALKNALRSWRDFRFAFDLANQLKHQEPDVIEFMDIHAEAYGFLKGFPNRESKVVIRSHTPWGILRETHRPEDSKGTDAWFAKKREQYCFEQCDAITTPRQDLKNRLMRDYGISPDKITVLPNILDTAHYRPLASKRQDNKFRILHVGRFEWAKGVVTLMKAFGELAKDYDHVELEFVGKARGNAVEEVERLIEAYQIEDQVHFTGFVAYDDLPQKYADADIVVVSPEIYESYSYTAAQAMACAKPVVASAIGGITETLDHGNAGLLYPPKDSQQLTNQLAYLVKNPEQLKVIGNKAYQFINGDSSFEVLKPKYLSFYRSLLE